MITERIVTPRVWYARMEGGLMNWEAIVGARKVKVKGWPHLDLCWHRHLFAEVKGVCVWEYVVTEGHTGRALAIGSTYVEMGESLLRGLEGEGREKIDAVIAQRSAGLGLSPRYEREEETE